MILRHHPDALKGYLEQRLDSVKGIKQDNRLPELVDGDRKQNSPPVIQEEEVSNLLSHVHACKSVGPDGIHPRLTRELSEELTKPLAIIYQQYWLTGEVPDDWKLVGVTPIHNEDLGNYRPVSLTLVPGKVTERHGFRMGRSCLITVWSNGQGAVTFLIRSIFKKHPV
ncbi:hypothetical protein DUI87_18604 [Hirundo rustica rustica]|uniref:Uncharacterized protein n=1 Tax=Hirundo rustica rustica TaxID=333673 RepID=A0A3M0JWM3_HIRRU|nr:hypothetical protein DUI87_18604 [Hirundo rustica rustica]